MVEPNWMKWLFGSHQKWSIADASALVSGVWRSLEYRV